MYGVQCVITVCMIEMKPQVEEFRRSVLSSLPEDLPVSNQVLKAWKLIFESLTRCIKQRNDAQATFNTLINVMMSQLENSSSTFCPKETDIKGRNELEITCKCYIQFHTYMTNLFLYLAMKDTELRMFDKITEFYIGLLKLLHHCDISFLINLIEKMRHALNTILCSYTSTQLASVEVEIGMFVIERPTFLTAPYVPNEALQPFTVCSKIEATRLVTLLSTLIFNSKDFLCGTQLQVPALRVLYKRFHAVELFGAKDINQFHMLDSLRISTHHEIVPVVSQLVQQICERVGEPQDNDWRQLEIQALNLLTEEFPSKFLQGTQILRLITDVILRRLIANDFEETTMKSYLRVFANLMRSSPGAVLISDKHVKWLAHKFCMDADEIYLSLLMLYMEAELLTVLPSLLAREQFALSVKSSKESRSFRQHHSIIKWHTAEEYSIVWQILKSLFYRILSRLEAQTENFNSASLVPIAAENHKLDMLKLNLILRGITVICCKIDDVQKKQREEVVLISFSFFQSHLETVVHQTSTLPVFCTVSTGTATDELKMWQLFLELVNFIRYLTEFSWLDLKCIGLLEALTGLLWLRGDSENEPSLADKQHVILQAGKLSIRLGDWRNQPINSFPCDEKDVCGLIIQLFFKEFHQTKGPVSGWRANVLRQSLHINSPQLCIAAIHCTPLVLSSCNKDDIASIVDAFQLLRNPDDSSVAVALAQTVPMVVCILSGWCCSFKAVTEEDSPTSYYKDKVRIQVCCYHCDSSIPPVSQSWSMLHTLQGFTDNWKGLLVHENKAVRLLMAQGFKRIGRHLRATLLSTDLQIWLKLLADEDPEVGSAFVPHIPLLFHDVDLDSPMAMKIFQVVFNEIQSAIQKCITNNSIQHWRVIVDAIVMVSKIHLPFACVPLVKVYTLLLVLGNDKCCFINQTVITSFAHVYQTTPKALFWPSFDDVCQIAVDALEVIEPREVNIITCMTRVTSAFSVEDYVLKKQLHRLLCVLIPKCIGDTHMQMYVCQIAKYLEADVKSMFTAWFPLIYPKLHMDQNELLANKCVVYLLKTMETDEAKIVRTCEPFIISTLVAQFSSKPSKVLRIITRTKELTSTDDVILIDNSVSDPKEILQPYLHGILVSLQSRIMQKYIREDEKIEAMNSLGKLFSFMGISYIEPYLNKILDMLCTFAQFKQSNVIKAYCQLVLAFVKCLRIKSHLTEMAHIIVSNLVHIDWDLFSGDLKPILDLFLCSTATRNTLTTITYIGPMLKHFNFEQHIARMKTSQQEQTVQALFTHISRSIQSPRERNQLLAVLELKSSIGTKQAQLQQLLLHDNKHFNPLKQVYGKLINVCASGTPELRVAGADCLGTIGALSPTNWVTAYGFNLDYKFYLDSLSPDFIVGSFELLVEELQSASNCTDMDVIAFVCQELMKAHHFQDEPMKAPTEVWSVLSDSAQLMLLPFFKSSYKSHKAVNDAKQVPHPIFGSHLGKTFQSWLFHWVCRLIQYIRDEQAKRVFAAMRYLFKINSKCLFFFLPHIFMHALWSATWSEKEKIFEEMAVAAKFSLKEPGKKGEEKNEDPCELLKSTLASTPGLHSFAAIDMSNEKTSLLASCSQVIFYLVDYMHQWCYRFLRARVSEHKSKPKARTNLLLDSENLDPKMKPSKFSGMDERHSIIKSALDSLDLIALAESCHLCNNNYRALRYIEMYTAHNKKNLQQHLGLILRIYTQIGNNDGVWGIISSIAEQPTSVEQILNDEMNGHFDKAIPGYESLQQQNHLSSDIIQNMAKCYLGLEVYHSAIALIERHCNVPNLEARDMLLSVKLEVLWRMEDWQQLENMLQNCSSARNARPTWATYLARILVYMNSRDLCNAEKVISDCRNELGLWLHNSNFKSTSYTQNYFIFLMMHLISDLADVIQFLALYTDKKTNRDDLAVAFNKMFDNMKIKQERTSLHWQCGQQLLAMQRTILKTCINILESEVPEIGTSAKEKIAELWLDSAYLALSYRQFLQAITYSRKAEEAGESKAFVVMARAEWESGNQEYAIAAKLLLAGYSSDMKITDVLNSVRLYKEALNVYLFWEDSWVEAARAWQKLDINIHQVFFDEKSLGILKEIVRAYSNALVCGIKYIYESLPAIIAIWANAGLACHQANTSPEHQMASKEKGILFSYFKLFSDTMREYMASKT
ncbi:hypothetical protein B566_EDAN015485 [Ephemera danica]|nr:hypothetical protein B566_EDAN015485 [Ephemera danica]